jgi:2-oxoglutarate dehydrogenase E2 component (dihydrolipoamide succinyltransferase)
MSLEQKIEALTAAVVALTAKLESSNVAAPAPVAPAPAPVVQAAPVAVAPAPVAAAPVMPAPPSFTPAAMAPAMNPSPTATATSTTSSAPFSDPKGLIDYVMGAYKALGPQKGALIQGVLTGLGYQNINDVKPEHYAALHTGVEALK